MAGVVRINISKIGPGLKERFRSFCIIITFLFFFFERKLWLKKGFDFTVFLVSCPQVRFGGKRMGDEWGNSKAILASSLLLLLLSQIITIAPPLENHSQVTR